VLAYGWIVFVLLVTLAPHIGILLMSFQGLELFGAARQLHAGALRHRVQRCPGMIYNTLKYCLMAAGLDIVLGTAIAYLIYRTDLPARQWLDYWPRSRWPFPGLVLAIGYLRCSRA
jgi:iron(III) transport system permease protein